MSVPHSGSGPIAALYAQLKRDVLDRVPQIDTVEFVPDDIEAKRLRATFDPYRLDPRREPPTRTHNVISLPTEHSVVPRLIRSARSWTTATAETVAVFLATAVILFPGVTALGTVVGVRSGVVHIAIEIVAFGATYAFVAGEWSIRTLGEYFFAFAASTVVGLGVGATVLATGIVTVPVGEPLVRLGLWCLVYVVASGAVASGVTGRVLSR